MILQKNYFNPNNYIDFHTHLNDYPQDELFFQLKDFSGIIITASCDSESYKKNCLIQNKSKNFSKLKIIPTFGIHPKQAANCQNDLSVYDEICYTSPIIGEIGLDLCWAKDVPFNKQEKVFRYFLEHCNANKKYCVIHCKDAEKQVSQILLDYPEAKPIIHWYDGPINIYKEFIKRGYYQTFGCESIRSKHIQNLLLLTPPNLILAETDNPESEPWLGGSDNSIFLIKKIYQDISQISGRSLVDIQNIINSNSMTILEEAFSRLCQFS